jgi:hypothetical protein
MPVTRTQGKFTFLPGKQGATKINTGTGGGNLRSPLREAAGQARRLALGQEEFFLEHRGLEFYYPEQQHRDGGMSDDLLRTAAQNPKAKRGSLVCHRLTPF